jgi:serine phosphatase RsbU (regulator of sigma subunit)/tetratricopeptide (TPR) repeat protein
VDALNLLTKLLSADDPANALYYGKQALKGAEELGDDKRKAWALNYLGSIYYYRSEYDSSLYYHNQAMDIRLQIDDPKGLGASYNNIGMILDDQGKSNDALDYYLKAITQFQKAKFDLGLAVVYGSIGNLYYYQKDFFNSETYYRKSLLLYEKTGNRRGVMNSYNNLALINEENGDTTSALNMLFAAKRIAEEEGFTATLITCLNNIGQVYTSRNQVDKALPLLRRAVALGDSIGDVTKTISALYNIAACLRIQGKTDSAISYTNESLRLARQTAFLPSVKECYLQLAELYTDKNDYKTAYGYRADYERVKDSVFNEEKSGQLAEMQTRYDTEQVKKDNLLKDERLHRQMRERWFYIAGAAFLAIISVLIFLALRKTRKLNHLLSAQKTEILEKNFDLSHKNELIEEQKREITSSIEYARNIQQAMLPSPAELKQRFPGAFVFFRPRDIVSGDFYFISGNDDYTLVAAADCTGHGVPGALMSMIGMEKLREAADLYELPGEMLTHLNKAVKTSLQDRAQETGGRQVQDGMEMLLCRFDRKNMRLTIASANRPLLLLRGGILIEYKPEKAAIGGITPGDYSFTTESILLEPGDSIYLFTDGYADQFGGEGTGKKFTMKRLRELLTGISGLPFEQQADRVEQAFDEWKGSLDQVDDVLLMGIGV